MPRDRLLFAISDRAVADGGQLERHADLVHGEKRSVGAEFADGPRDRRDGEFIGLTHVEENKVLTRVVFFGEFGNADFSHGSPNAG